MTNMTQKYGRLSDKLVNLTVSKLLEWEYDQPTDACRTKVGDKIIEVKMGRNDIEEPIAIVSVFNASGNLAERFTDETLSDLKTNTRGYDSYWKLLEYLHETAKNQATGVGKDLDDLLEQLDEIFPF